MALKIPLIDQYAAIIKPLRACDLEDLCRAGTQLLETEIPCREEISLSILRACQLQEELLGKALIPSHKCKHDKGGWGVLSGNHNFKGWHICQICGMAYKI